MTSALMAILKQPFDGIRGHIKLRNKLSPLGVASIIIRREFYPFVDDLILTNTTCRIIHSDIS